MATLDVDFFQKNFKPLENLEDYLLYIYGLMNFYVNVEFVEPKNSGGALDKKFVGDFNEHTLGTFTKKIPSSGKRTHDSTSYALVFIVAAKLLKDKHVDLVNDLLGLTTIDGKKSQRIPKLCSKKMLVYWKVAGGIKRSQGFILTKYLFDKQLNDIGVKDHTELQRLCIKHGWLQVLKCLGLNSGILLTAYRAYRN